jgi:hypothetical protein
MWSAGGLGNGLMEGSSGGGGGGGTAAGSEKGTTSRAGGGSGAASPATRSTTTSAAGDGIIISSSPRCDDHGGGEEGGAHIVAPQQHSSGLIALNANSSWEELMLIGGAGAAPAVAVADRSHNSSNARDDSGSGSNLIAPSAAQLQRCLLAARKQEEGVSGEFDMLHSAASNCAGAGGANSNANCATTVAVSAMSAVMGRCDSLEEAGGLWLPRDLLAGVASRSNSIAAAVVGAGGSITSTLSPHALLADA